jgi:hypothetical protein
VGAAGQVIEADAKGEGDGVCEFVDERDTLGSLLSCLHSAPGTTTDLTANRRVTTP